MKLVIDRKRWLRGTQNESALLDGHGRMCCLGFFGEACGIEPGNMIHVADPEECDDGILNWPAWLLVPKSDSDDPGDERLRNTEECGNLIETNDDEDMTDAVREERIAAIFAAHGVEVEFTDG